MKAWATHETVLEPLKELTGLDEAIVLGSVTDDGQASWRVA